MPTRRTKSTVEPAVKTAAGRRRANKVGAVSTEERRRLIAEAAYFRAERAVSPQAQRWTRLESEAEIDALLAARQG